MNTYTYNYNYNYTYEYYVSALIRRVLTSRQPQQQQPLKQKQQTRSLIQPFSECEFQLQSILEELQVRSSPYPTPTQPLPPASNESFESKL